MQTEMKAATETTDAEATTESGGMIGIEGTDPETTEIAADETKVADGMTTADETGTALAKIATVVTVVETATLTAAETEIAIPIGDVIVPTNLLAQIHPLSRSLLQHRQQLSPANP